MREVTFTGPLAREAALRQEFYNKCHDEGGRFCSDGSGGKGGKGRLKGKLTDSDYDLIDSASTEAGREEYQKLLENREALEPYYTDGLQALARDNGGTLEIIGPDGEDHTYKSNNSIKSRVARNIEKAAEKGKTITEEQAISDLGDTLRYTMTFPDDRYSEGVRNAITEITDESTGLQFEDNKVMSSWAPGGQYAGINTTMVDKATGFKTELQFHTKSSYEAKNDLHNNYEYLRELEGTNEDRYNRWSEMTERTNQVSRPEGWEDIEGSTINGVKLNPKPWRWDAYLRERPGDYGPLYASANSNLSRVSRSVGREIR